MKSSCDNIRHARRRDPIVVQGEVRSQMCMCVLIFRWLEGSESTAPYVVGSTSFPLPGIPLPAAIPAPCPKRPAILTDSKPVGRPAHNGACLRRTTHQHGAGLVGRLATYCSISAHLVVLALPPSREELEVSRSLVEGSPGTMVEASLVPLGTCVPRPSPIPDTYIGWRPTVVDVHAQVIRW